MPCCGGRRPNSPHRGADTAVGIAGARAGSGQLRKDGAEAVRCFKRSPPRKQFSNAQGAGDWQRYPIHAMPGACRAERAKKVLPRGRASPDWRARIQEKNMSRSGSKAHLIE